MWRRDASARPSPSTHPRQMSSRQPSRFCESYTLPLTPDTSIWLQMPSRPLPRHTLCHLRAPQISSRHLSSVFPHTQESSHALGTSTEESSFMPQVPPYDGGSPPCWTRYLKGPSGSRRSHMPLQSCLKQSLRLFAPREFLHSPTPHPPLPCPDETCSLSTMRTSQSAPLRTPPTSTEIPPPHFFLPFFSFLSHNTRDSFLP